VQSSLRKTIKPQLSPGNVLKPALTVLAAWLCATLQTWSATVWDGPVITFSEATTDPILASNQDRMTANVWITRAQLQGIFNAKAEFSFTHSFSPADTEWANGTLANYASLSYTDWNTWAKDRKSTRLNSSHEWISYAVF